MKPLTLRRNFSWTFIGNAVFAACQWGMLVVIAKFGSPEMVGQFTLGLAVTAPIIMFANLQLRSVQVTDIKQEYLFADYLGLRLVTTGLALIAIVGITLLAGYRWETSLVLVVTGLVKAVDSIRDVFQGLIQRYERMDHIAISAMIRGPLSLLFLSIGLYLTHSVLWGITGLLVALIIVFVSYDIRSALLVVNDISQSLHSNGFYDKNNLALLRPRLQWNKLKKLVWLVLPLGFVMMLISLNTNIPRYFIEHYLGERELGFFAAISYLMVVTGMLISALGESASPRLAQYYSQGNRKAFLALLTKLVGIGFTMGVLGVLVVLIAGRQILTVLYRPEYAEYLDIFVLIMITTAISDVSSFLGYGMTAARYFSAQVPVFMMVTGTSALSCFWLIPNMGLRGAAIALLIGASIQALLSAAINIYALNKLPEHWEEKHEIF